MIELPRRTRHDGWTDTRRAAFIAARRGGATIAGAAAAAGMSRRSAYRLRGRPDGGDVGANWAPARIDADVVAAMVDAALERGHAAACAGDALDEHGLLVELRRRGRSCHAGGAW